MSILNLFSNVIVNISGFFLYLILVGINKTIHVDVRNYSGKVLFKNENYIFAFWHKNIFVLYYLYRNNNIFMFVSDNFKGKVLGAASRKLGYAPFPLEKKLSRSIKKMSKKVENNQNVAMAVDGPSGPFMCVKTGTQYLTKKTGIPTIAVAVHYSSYFTLFWRWDKYLVPLPFSRVAVTLSQLFDVNSEWNTIKEYL